MPAPPRMPPATVIALASLAFLPPSGSAAGRGTLSLAELQSMQQTLFDEELLKLAGAHRETTALPYQTVRCDHANDEMMTEGRTSHLRRRALTGERSPEQIYEGIVEHAWDAAAALRHPSPFLICTDGLESVNEGALWMPSPMTDETCFVEMLSAAEAWRLQERMTVLQPVADVMKIDPRAVDVVTSSAWRIPFEDRAGIIQQHTPMAAPAIDSSPDESWERTIKVHFRPSIWIEDDADLAHDVHALASDIQRWAGFGWAVRHERIYDEDERRSYAAKSLSDAFSLTSATFQTMLHRNHRVAFWDQSLRNGLEADHACSEMFTHLQVRPSENELGGRYRSAELVLNPNGGPRPRSEEASASNPACVLSLLAGLAVHPRVLSIGVNAPVANGSNRTLSQDL